MRILLSADPEIPVPPETYGGIQRIVAWLCDHLTEQGHSVALIAHPESRQSRVELFPWKELHSQSTTALWRNVPVFARACTDFQPDIIHSFSRLAFAAYPLFRALPTLMSYQRIPGATQTRGAYRLSRGRLHFSGCSGYIAGIGSQYTPHWRTIPNFLPDTLYRPSYEIADDAPLLFLSRLDPIKGAHTAIEIARKTGVPLVIAGNVPENDSSRSYFDAKIRPHIDNSFITYTGPVDDDEKQRLLSESRALLLPLEWDEPFGIVFIEALACGTPVITAPRGAAPEIIASGTNGFLCRSFTEFVNATAQIHTIDRTLCRQSFMERYSGSVVCRKYEETYTALVKH